MNYMMVLNPSHDKGKPMAAKRRRKMTAKQRKFFGTRAQRRAAGGKVVTLKTNPTRKRSSAVARKRKRKSPSASSRKVRRFRNNPRPKTRRFRRNPIAGMSGLTNSIIPAAVGALGAVGVDYALPYIPANLRSPNTLPLWRIAGAFGIGWLVKMVAGPKAGAEATAGGLVVALYSFARQTMAAQGMMPGQLAYGGIGQGAGLNRYLGGMGFVKRGPGLGAQQQRARQLGVRRLRRLQGLQDQVQANIARTRQNLNGLGPFPNNFPGAHSQLGATSPNSVTKFRLLRDGSTMDDSRQTMPGHTGLGYIGPARTLGRYLGKR